MSKNARPYLEITKVKSAGYVAQAVECLPGQAQG
jgi:hypothetical protein